MNKKLVAVAIAGLLAAPVVQAQTANVTLYGRLHLDFEVVNARFLTPGAVQPAACLAGPTAGTVASCNTSNPNQFRVSSNSSRFGIRGTESLGGGLNAIFQVENSVNPDAGGGVLAGRDSFLGFQGSWGTARIGRFHAPYDHINDFWGSVPTLETGILASGSIWAQGTFAKANGGFDDRVANSLRWDSPVMSGFQLQIQYGAGGPNNEGTSTTTASNTGVWSGGVFYENGPIGLGAAFQKNIQFRARGLDDLAWSVTGYYQFPKVRVGLVYERLDYDFTTTTSLTRNMYGVGITIDAGPGQIYAMWQRGANGKGSAPTGSRIGGLAKGDGTSANQYEISYNHPLSKRTQVYVGYTRVANDANASYNFGVNTYQSAIGGRPQGIIFGAFHNF